MNPKNKTDLLNFNLTVLPSPISDQFIISQQPKANVVRSAKPMKSLKGLASQRPRSFAHVKRTIKILNFKTDL